MNRVLEKAKGRIYIHGHNCSRNTPHEDILKTAQKLLKLVVTGITREKEKERERDERRI
jgi:CO dehydrogenase/acetyl-CoA synthase epsilon subunit